jgi:hypothetical protein
MGKILCAAAQGAASAERYTVHACFFAFLHQDAAHFPTVSAMIAGVNICGNSTAVPRAG